MWFDSVLFLEKSSSLEESRLDSSELLFPEILLENWLARLPELLLRHVISTEIKGLVWLEEDTDTSDYSTTTRYYPKGGDWMLFSLSFEAIGFYNCYIKEIRAVARLLIASEL